MASLSRRSNATVIDDIEKNVTAFNLDQLIKLLLAEDDVRTEEICDRIDHLFVVSSHVRYDLPPSIISGLKKVERVNSEGESKAVTKLLLNYFGIAAFNSPLPQPYIEWIFREIHDGLRKRERSPILDFLDIFNHRMLAIRHQNRAEQRISLSADHPNHSDVAKRIESLAGFFDIRMFDLVAIGLYNRKDQLLDEREQKDVEHHLIQTFSGLMYNPRKSSAYIKALLSSVFNAEVVVEQFLGQWLTLEQEDVNQLAVVNSILGENTILGKKCWDQQSLMGITIGPLNYQTFLAMMPGGRFHRSLVSLIRFLSDGDWDCRVRLTLAAKDIPLATLVSETGAQPSSADDAEYASSFGMKLGATSWLKSQTYTKLLNRVQLGVNSWLNVSLAQGGFAEFGVNI